MRYRRASVVGGTYFFTVNLADRDQVLLTRHADALRNAMRTVKHRHPFEVDAMVILPDHLRAIWTLPTGDADYPTRWALIKPDSRVTFRLPSTALQVAKARANAASGNAAIGNTRFAMIVIWPVMSITSTTIRSSMAM